MTQIQNRRLPEAGGRRWHYPMAKPAPHLPQGHAHLWILDVNQSTNLQRDFRASLSEAEALKTLRMKHNPSRWLFEGAHIFLRYLLGQYLEQNPAELLFEYGTHQKPYLAGSSRLQFSLSHAGSLVAVLVSLHEVGVDLEQLSGQDKWEDLSDHVLSPAERDFVRGSARPSEEFYLCWTRKEALLKAVGIGLVDPLLEIPSLDGVHQLTSDILPSHSDWRVDSLLFSNQYAVSCALPPGCSLEIYLPPGL